MQGSHGRSRTGVAIGIAATALAAALAQAIVLRQRPLAVLFYDTSTYVQAALAIQHHLAFVDPLRTPGYPALLAIVFRIAGESYEAVVWVQAALVVAVALETFWLALALTGRTWLATIAGVVVGANIAIASWERDVLTETLAIWTFVSLCLVAVLLVRRVSAGLVAAGAVLAVLGVLTRPSLIYLPLVVAAALVLWHWRAGSGARALAAVSVLAVAAYLAVGLYSFANLRQNGYFGVSCVTNTNMLGKVMEYRMQADADPARYGRITADVEAFVRKNPAAPNPLAFLEQNPQYAGDCARAAGTYATNAILRHPLHFARASLGDAVTVALSDPVTQIYAPLSWKPAPVAALLGLSEAELQSHWMLALLPVVAGLAWWRRDPFLAGETVLLASAAGLIVLVGFSSSGELSRLRAPADPLLLVAAVVLAAELSARALRPGGGGASQRLRAPRNAHDNHC